MYSENQSNYLQILRKLPQLSVHLVCLGNICRSPIANAVLSKKFALLEKPKVVVDSSGTGPWHEGEGASAYSIQVWQEAGYRYQHVAKQFKVNFFTQHNLILAMDLDNRKALLKLAKSQAEKEKIFMLASFDPKLDKIDPDGDDAHLLAIPDPYGKELAAYRQVLEMIERSSDGLISWLNS